MNVFYNYDFLNSFHEWSKIPIDDVGYFGADELLNLIPEQLIEIAKTGIATRFDPSEWRNHENRLADFMNLGNIKGKTVLDFGCGYGADSSIFAAYGADCILADIHPRLVMVAERVVSAVTGILPKKTLVGFYPPYFKTEPIDLFWSCGVLHHIPYAGEILKNACSHLKKDGECRVILYSDLTWTRIMKEPVPDYPTWKHPRFMEFVRANDPVGSYSDWYSAEKLAAMVNSFGTLVESKYIGRNNEFLGGIIRSK